MEEAEQLGVTQLQQNPSGLDAGVRRFFSRKVNPKKKKIHTTNTTAVVMSMINATLCRFSVLKF